MLVFVRLLCVFLLMFLSVSLSRTLSNSLSNSWTFSLYWTLSLSWTLSLELSLSPELSLSLSVLNYFSWNLSLLNSLFEFSFSSIIYWLFFHISPKMLRFVFKIPDVSQMKRMRTLLKMMLYFVDFIVDTPLSKDVMAFLSNRFCPLFGFVFVD